jgi:hypothetical protein
MVQPRRRPRNRTAVTHFLIMDKAAHPAAPALEFAAIKELVRHYDLSQSDEQPTVDVPAPATWTTRTTQPSRTPADGDDSQSTCDNAPEPTDAGVRSSPSTYPNKIADTTTGPLQM